MIQTFLIAIEPLALPYSLINFLGHSGSKIKLRVQISRRIFPCSPGNKAQEVKSNAENCNQAAANIQTIWPEFVIMDATAIDVASSNQCHYINHDSYIAWFVALCTLDG